MEIIIEFGKLLIPALLVLYAMYLTVKTLLEKEKTGKELDLKIKTYETLFPLRIQAYERLTLLLERISPNNMLVRLSNPKFTANEFQRLLVREIRDESIILALENGLAAGDHTFSIVGADNAGNDFASVRRNIRVPEWAVIPASSQLLQNYPNPFNPETWIPYRLSESASVRVSIYSLSGKLVRTLELGVKNPGTYTDKERAVYWDGRNENGETLSSGVYFYHLSAGTFAAVRKMIVSR